jgi:hypothetical protein
MALRVDHADLTNVGAILLTGLIVMALYRVVELPLPAPRN